MKFASTFLAIASAALPALAAEYSLELKPSNTAVQWTLGDVLHTVHGTFKLKRGAIGFDTESGKASGQLIVDVASGNSGSDARDRRMHASVLESAKYPEAVFTPDRFEGTLVVPGASSIKLHGTFNIHGTAHGLTMDVQTKASADQMNATVTFDIPYVAWGMKDPSNFVLKVNKTVRISIEAGGPIQKR